MFDEHLVHALIGGKDLNRGLAELGVQLGLMGGGFAGSHGPRPSNHDASGLAPNLGVY